MNKETRYVGRSSYKGNPNYEKDKEYLRRLYKDTEKYIRETSGELIRKGDILKSPRIKIDTREDGFDIYIHWDIKDRLHQLYIDKYGFKKFDPEYSWEKFLEEMKSGMHGDEYKKIGEDMLDYSSRIAKIQKYIKHMMDADDNGMVDMDMWMPTAPPDGEPNKMSPGIIFHCDLCKGVYVCPICGRDVHDMKYESIVTGRNRGLIECPNEDEHENIQVIFADESEGDYIPVLLGFPCSDYQVKVWCPHCREWHYHGLDKPESRGRLGHRCAHCRHDSTTESGPYEKTGYYIKYLSEQEYKEIITGIESDMDRIWIGDGEGGG